MPTATAAGDQADIVQVFGRKIREEKEDIRPYQQRRNKKEKGKKTIAEERKKKETEEKGERSIGT